MRQDSVRPEERGGCTEGVKLWAVLAFVVVVEHAEKASLRASVAGAARGTST